MRLNFDITKIEPMHPGSAIARVQWGLLELRRLNLKYTWQVTPCLLHIIDGRLPTGSTNFDDDGG